MKGDLYLKLQITLNILIKTDQMRLKILNCRNNFGYVVKRLFDFSHETSPRDINNFKAKTIIFNTSFQILTFKLNYLIRSIQPISLIMLAE